MDVHEALDALLPPDQRTGDLSVDLIAAVREAAERRRRNSEHGGAVIAELVARGVSYRQIEDLTGVPPRHGTEVGHAALVRSTGNDSDGLRHPCRPRGRSPSDRVREHQ